MKGVTFILFLAASLNSIMGQTTFGLKDTFTSVPNGVVELLRGSATRQEKVLDTVYNRQILESYRSYDSTVTVVRDIDSSVRVWALYFDDSKVIVRNTWVKVYNGYMNYEVLYIPKPFYRSDSTPYPIDVRFPQSLGIGIYFESVEDMAPRYQKGILEGVGVPTKIGEFDYLTYKNIEGHFWVDVPKVFPNVVYLN